MEPPKYAIFNPFRRYHTLNIPEGVARFRGLSPGAKLVYGRLYRYAGQKGVAFPSVEALSEEVGLGVRQTQAYIAELQEQNFIYVQRRYHQGCVYQFQDHPALTKGEIGLPRWGNPEGVKPQDTAESLLKVCPQDTAVSADAVSCGLTDAPSLLTEEGHYEEGHSIPTLPNQTPFDPESLTKLLCQKFKRLKGVNSFNATARDIVARSSNMLDADLSEDQVVELFDRWAHEDYWREFDTPHKVRSFFSWTKEAATSPCPEAAASVADLMPARRMSSGTLPANGPVGLPAARDYPALWNELVPEKPTDPILFATVNPKVWKVAGFAERFEDICRKARELLKAGVDVNLLRLIKDFGSGIYGWQEMLAGAMDPKKNGKPAPKVSGEDWQVAKARRIAREKEEAERAASTKVST